jgi:hypothetical protein
MKATQPMRRGAIAALLAILALGCGTPFAQTSAPGGSYRYNAPAGWTRALVDGIETFTPNSEPPDSVQLMLMAPQALPGDLQAAFNAQRRDLEGTWGLSQGQPLPPQAGRVGTNSYAAHFASYDSSGGARYMGFMALGLNGQLAMLVLVAASADAFNRVAPQAVALLQSLQFAR